MRPIRVVSLVVALALVGVVPAIAKTSACTAPAGGFEVMIERSAPYRNRFGERIAVDVHRPAAAAGCRFPVVLELSAYRDWIAPENLDAAATEDERRAWWVRQGYVFAFADVPGTGNSEGTWCMFCEREQLSGVDMVNALGAAPWANGRVGLIGGSYPAINALLIAQHRPKHLTAVIAAAFASDLYDDLFYPGGMRRGEDALAIGAVFSYIDRDPRFLTIADEHPTNDEWYAERRLRPEDVKVPVYALGGWNDIFDRSVWRTFDRLGSTEKVLRQGPFTHVPVVLQPDAWPCIAHESDFCGAAFFDHHLKRVESAAYDALIADPVQVYVEPSHGWQMSDAKPITTPWRMTLGAPGEQAVVPFDPTAGATGGRWFLRGSVPGTYPPIDHVLGVDGPADQRVEEAKLVSIASPVLTEAVTIIGGGSLSLVVRADAAAADLAVRIIDEYPVGSAEHPEGFAYRVGGGWLRAALVPGEPAAVTIDLWPIGYRFAAGHRIRIDIAGADVPRFAPPTEPVTVTIDLGASEVRLPRA